MKKRLILHVGLHKTGTSYLQSFLYRNRDALRARGVLYPEWYLKASSANHYPLAKRLELDTEYAGLAAELAALAAAEDIHTVVLSSERLCSLFHRHGALTEAFQAAFSPHFAISVVVYLRRQDEMMESVFAEMAKRSQISVDRVLLRKMNWFRQLQQLREAFGPDSVIARPFVPKAWPGGNLARDFLAVAGLGPFEGLEDVERTNESMPRRKTLFLSDIDKSRLPKLALFLDHVRASPAIADDGQRWMLSPAQRRQVVQMYADSNRMLCERYLDGAWIEHFTAIPADDGSWTPPAPISAAERDAVMLAFGRGQPEGA